MKKTEGKRKMKNAHLVPEIIINLVDQYKAAKRQNEIYALEDRLNAILEYVNESIKDATKTNIWDVKKK
jgi:hypothetical protein